ncbi:MAG: hypothetical protein KME03_07845 [Aphanocapsa lilacina HA4352-LM1]|nr:hypothetical protein [Aphanocapsa lilacina HA4352-LM1]
MSEQQPPEGTPEQESKSASVGPSSPDLGRDNAGYLIQPKTKLGLWVKEVVLSASESIDPLGRALMGDFWRIVYLTIQDAIALSVLLRIPGLIGEWIIGKSFASFDVCLDENPLGPAFYACFIIGPIQV